ncbi:MAG: putative T4-like proximal tail fiber [candidate division WS6 bacterium 34_10]|uniref:Putative T4-like proximal tail fiber n=1 Tax=candidate division WS6 bacterium 34_10 TaxID=1641389 RepID=A0A101HJS5_9BACT|nr:MAG: putative T4-like proximal tail fiber [candidate division WS6 bacterium 34_10]
MQEKNRRNLSKFVIIFFGILIPSFIFLGLLKGPIYSATSDTVNLQGKIVRNDAGYEGLNVTAGNPSCVVVGSGNDTCDFRIRYYDSSTAGNLLLTEQFSNIEIGQYLGVFNLSLGSDPAPVAGVYSSFSALIQGEDSVYVEVGFDPSGLNTYTEVFTRMPLQATGYAIRAKYADNATGATELPWSGLKDPTADLTIEHTTRKTLFNWATGTGTNDLFSLTSNASANGTGALMNIQTGVGSALVPLRVRSGSTEAIYVNSSGNVGIGTTTPENKLHVSGNIELGVGDTSRQILAYNATHTYGGLLELYNLATGNTTLSTNFASGDIILLPGTSGNIGIGTTDPSYLLDVSGGTGIVAQFSGRVIGADAVNSNELVTKSQLDSIGGSITTYWQRTSPNLSPLNANDSVLPNISGDLGAAGLRWGTIYGNTGSFSTLEGNSTLTLQPSADGQDAVRIVDKTTLTSILSVDTLNSRVGIGTTSPDSALHVAGQVKITGGTPGTNKVLTSDIAGLASWADLGSLGGVTSVTGTKNQITASPTTGDVILSIPTDFRAPGTVNAFSGIYTGATGPTAEAQRIDASGNLLNIGDITFTAAGVTLDTDSLSPNILSLASGDSFNLVSGSLQVGGVEVITSGRLVRAANGSATTPSFSFSADDNTGMYSGGTDILKFATAGADRVTVLADGKMGVGTTSPGKALDVAGDIRLRGDAATLNFYRNTSPTDIAYIKYDEVGASFDIATDNRDIRFLNKVTWGESMRITSTGSVGIGTPSPVSLFSVGATSQFQVDTSGDITKIKNLSYTWPTAHTTNGYLKNNGTGGLSWAEVNAVQSTRTTIDGTQTKGPVAFWSGSDTINSANGVGGMYWDDTQGYLGIGTDTPSAPLDIAGGTGGSLIKNSSGDITIEPAQNLIISQGNVGIGTPSPLAKLHVKGNQILLKNEANADVGFVLDSGSTATYRDVITFKDRGTDIFALEKTSTNAFQLYDYAGTGVSRILVEGGTNSGISFRTKGTGDFSFITDTTTRVTIKSDGKVGIGTTGPGGLLDINAGTLTWGVPVISQQWTTNDSGYNLRLETLWTDAGVNQNFVQKYNSVDYNVLSFYVGNVGIGTTTPSGKFDVANSFYASTGGLDIRPQDATYEGGELRLLGAGTNPYFAIDNYGGRLRFIRTDPGGAEVMTILQNSNVGIGTGSPAAKLEILGDILQQNANKLRAKNSAGTVETWMWPRWTNNIMYTNFGSGGWHIRNSSSATVMFMQNGGNVGIGTMAPSYKLDVKVGSTAFTTPSGTWAARIINTTDSSTYHGVFIGNRWKNSLSTAFEVGNIWSGQYDRFLRVRGDGYVSMPKGYGADVAESHYIIGIAIPGSIVAIEEDKKLEFTQADKSKDRVIGVVSTHPSLVIDAEGGFFVGYDMKKRYENEKAPIALVGVVPTLVTSQKGNIQEGDYIGVSSIPGFGAKMVTEGDSVGKALEDFVPASQVCIPVSSIENISWPEDKGRNEAKPCFILPDGTYVGKIMVFVNVSWHDPKPGELLSRVEEIENQLDDLGMGTNSIYSVLDFDNSSKILTIDSSFVPATNNTYDLGTTENRWKDIYTQGTINLGNTTDNGSIRFNPDTKRLEFSNDGTNWIPFGSSTYTDLLAVQYPGSIVLDGVENNIGDITTDNTGLGNGSMNYYQWNSPGNIINSKEINIRYQLPSNFREWGSGGITLNYVTESTNSLENKVDMYVYEQSSTGYDVMLENNVSTTSEQWQTIEIDSSQLNMCNKAEDICIIKIKMSSSLDNYVRVGDIKIEYERTL